MSRVAPLGQARSALVAAVALVVVCVALPQLPTARAAWRYAGGSVTQQGFVNTEITRVGGIEWSFAAGTAVQTGVVMNGDGTRVYVVTQDQHVSCWSVPPSALGGLELAVGIAKPKLEWSFAVGSGVSTSPALSEDETMLFFG